jgi:hypothetical protein
MKTVKAIIELAKSWIGRNEKDGTHKMIIDLYNSYKPLARGYKVKYTDSWCATFISALAIKLGYTDIIPTECGCQQMIDLFKKIGVWVENENRTPNSGDIIFYDWQDSGSGDNQGWSDHVGIVETVSNGKIIVIEGNYSNAVKRRTLEVNGKYIRGYGVPKYDVEPAQKPVSEKELLEVDGEWGIDTTLLTQKVFGTTEDGEVWHQSEGCREFLENCLISAWKFDDTKDGSQLIRQIQTVLADFGYYKGEIDGLCGKQTVMAMQAFLNDNGFNCGDVDGYMGEKTVMAWQQYINSRL